MEYKIVYGTRIERDYYNVAAFLEENNVTFEKLHEYRLHGEFNDETNDPAIIRVAPNDFTRVENMLIEIGFIQTENSTPIKDDQLKNKSVLNSQILNDEIKSILGESITEVFYILANYDIYDYGTMHSVDVGIVLKIGDDKYLSWSFEEKDFDFEEEFFIPDSYQLRFKNILPEVDKHDKIVNLAENDVWKTLINDPIKEVKVYTQEFAFTEGFKSQTIVTDVVFETVSSKKVAILSSQEPDTIDGKLISNFEIDNEWSIVLFDEALINSSERIEK